VTDSNDSPAFDVVDRFLAGVESGMMPGGVFSDDAGLDATVPNWRFQVHGGEAVSAELARWYADPGQFLDVQRALIPGGELVEFTLSWSEQGVPHRVHQAHILRVAGDRISMDTAFCGGRWPADLLEEMERANPESAEA
jgi:hypothetical protein